MQLDLQQIQMHLAKTMPAHALSAAMDVDESEGSTSGNLLTGEVSPLQLLGTATDNQGIPTVLSDLDKFPAQPNLLLLYLHVLDFLDVNISC